MKKYFRYYELFEKLAIDYLIFCIYYSRKYLTKWTAIIICSIIFGFGFGDLMSRPTILINTIEEAPHITVQGGSIVLYFNIKRDTLDVGQSDRYLISCANNAKPDIAKESCTYYPILASINPPTFDTTKNYSYYLVLELPMSAKPGDYWYFSRTKQYCTGFSHLFNRCKITNSPFIPIHVGEPTPGNPSTLAAPKGAIEILPEK